MTKLNHIYKCKQSIIHLDIYLNNIVKNKINYILLFIIKLQTYLNLRLFRIYKYTENFKIKTNYLQHRNKYSCRLYLNYTLFRPYKIPKKKKRKLILIYLLLIT